MRPPSPQIPTVLLPPSHCPHLPLLARYPPPVPAPAQASALWERYAQASDELQRALGALCALHARHSPSEAHTWSSSLAEVAMLDVSEWRGIGGQIGVALTDVRDGCLSLRSLLRDISRAADTPIEPPEQTALLDATMAEQGVLMAVVPGAGGNDAVLALILPTSTRRGLGDGTSSHGPHSTESTRARLAAMWQAWPSTAPPPAPSLVCELPVLESKSGGRGHNGVLIEGHAAAEALRRAATGGGHGIEQGGALSGGRGPSKPPSVHA